MANCKYCNQPTKWPVPYKQGDRKLNLDGTVHDCPAFSQNGGGQQQPQTQQQQPQPEQPQPQGPSRYETSYLIPKVEWDQLRADIRHLTEYYTDLMEYVKLHLQNQKMADAEAQYDHDKEDGLI